MYQLTLSKAERQAIDWIGDRYAHGYDLFISLCEATWQPDNVDWDGDEDITFDIPEATAWDIQDIAEEGNHLWDCFGPELVEKLEELCGSIV